MGACGITYLDEIDSFDGGTVTTGTGVTSVTSRKNGIPVSIIAVADLKLCVYYLKHMERVQRNTFANSINLVLVRSYSDQQRHEVGFKKTAEDPVIEDKDWPRTLETIKEYLTPQYGGTGATLDYDVRPDIDTKPEDEDPAEGYYVVWPDIDTKPEAEDPVEGYETVDQEMTARVPHTGKSFVNDRRKVWDIMSNICGRHSCFLYINPALRTRNGRAAYMILFDHFLGPHNAVNMASVAETNLTGTLYNGEKKRSTWETYIRIHTEQHSVLNGLKDYDYADIDDSSNVRHLIKGIKTTELDVCKTQVVAIPSIRDYFAATVELYSTFIKKMKD
jgi:hypothetical protein